jgi:hypothetical protein
MTLDLLKETADHGFVFCSIMGLEFLLKLLGKLDSCKRRSISRALSRQHA